MKAQTLVWPLLVALIEFQVSARSGKQAAYRGARCHVRIKSDGQRSFDEPDPLVGWPQTPIPGSPLCESYYVATNFRF